MSPPGWGTGEDATRAGVWVSTLIEHSPSQPGTAAVGAVAGVGATVVCRPCPRHLRCAVGHLDGAGSAGDGAAGHARGGGAGEALAGDPGVLRTKQGCHVPASGFSLSR